MMNYELKGKIGVSSCSIQFTVQYSPMSYQKKKTNKQTNLDIFLFSNITRSIVGKSWDSLSWYSLGKEAKLSLLMRALTFTPTNIESGVSRSMLPSFVWASCTAADNFLWDLWMKNNMVNIFLKRKNCQFSSMPWEIQRIYKWSTKNS